MQQGAACPVRVASERAHNNAQVFVGIGPDRKIERGRLDLGERLARESSRERIGLELILRRERIRQLERDALSSLGALLPFFGGEVVEANAA
jgi:hypothetical protein